MTSGYHRRIQHNERVYVGNIHTNSVEGILESRETWHWWRLSRHWAALSTDLLE